MRPSHKLTTYSVLWQDHRTVAPKPSSDDDDCLQSEPWRWLVTGAPCRWMKLSALVGCQFTLISAVYLYSATLVNYWVVITKPYPNLWHWRRLPTAERSGMYCNDTDHSSESKSDPWSVLHELSAYPCSTYVVHSSSTGRIPQVTWTMMMLVCRRPGTGEDDYSVTRSYRQ